ncbi:Exonuclease [Quillaja saponaria]|uniref:Exonuclease n=1 Tax=Quillaja saponaria TaxID=32244 RepID=A0AAD7QAN4_QUISA|nr:Exonuclease [Quillaja saponaria]
MGLEENASEIHNKKDQDRQIWTICLHSFSDLTSVSPVVFLYLLKECYISGTLKAMIKFRALQQVVYLVLHNNPQPGPATFVVQCLTVLPIFGAYCEGFSHLIISSLRRLLKRATTPLDSFEVNDLAAQLFLDIVVGHVNYDERIVVKVLEVFDVKLTDIEKIMCQLKPNNGSSSDIATEFIEQYTIKLVKSQSYMEAVTLLEHFNIRQCGQSFLLNMIDNKQFKAAEKWATFMGKPMLSLLVHKYADRNMLKSAYDTIKKNNLQQDFPDVYHRCKESSLKMLAEKGCWDVAEAKTHNNRQLIEYLVYLAMEAGYMEKVDELRERYSLKGFYDIKVPESTAQHNRYLRLDELDVGDIIWVDEVDGLCYAISHIEGCKVVGLDCEWKPNFVKGSKPNKVSIMQIASDKMVFILDLIKLSGDVPEVLNDCLTRILHSPSILKLGYNFQCDIKQLAASYGELNCFKHYEMLLDIQNVFKEPEGGLSGLAKKILGAALNKTRRNSNWEQRPLHRNQLEYAALDAVVLIHIFSHVRCHSQPAASTEGHSQPAASTEGYVKYYEWKSHIASFPHG